MTGEETQLSRDARGRDGPVVSTGLPIKRT